MMKKTSVLAIALLATLLLVSIYAVSPVKTSARSDVDIRFYGSHDSAYAALKAGDVDFIQWSVTYEQRLDVEDDVNLCVTGYSENGMMEYDLNNNYTMPTYPGIKNPVTNKYFRRALSCMTDKEHITSFILKGAAGALNVPIPLNSLSWWPDCALPENYPWKYNETRAEEQLVLSGFVDTDDDDIRNYPVDWPGKETGPNMDPLIMYVRTEDKRLDAGRYLADQLDVFGIPYTKIEATSDVCFPAVMDDRNYHIYTGGWSLGRYPLFLYNGFHESFWFEGGSNYVTGRNESNLPNYPDYDALCRAVYYTESIETSQIAAWAAAELGWCDYVFNIPLWSYKSYVAWRKTMPGVINQFGYGYDNSIQFLNAYKTDASPIRMGTINAPKALNQFYSTWYYDYAVLDRVWNALITVNPYDLGIDQPQAVQDWEVGTWTDPSPGPDEPTEKTKVTYFIRKDVAIIAPDGTFVRNLTAHDIEFSCWYTYMFDDCWNWPDYSDVHHTNIIDDHTIEFYFDDASYWFYTSPQYPIIMKDTVYWDGLDLIKYETCTVHMTPTPGMIMKLTECNPQMIQTQCLSHGAVRGVDYYIFGGLEDYEHNWLFWITGGWVEDDYEFGYWTRDKDASGYYWAGLDWSDTWYSFGPFYPIAITEGVGGYASLNKNPYYFVGESPPPLGETDWLWVWDTPINPETGKPFNGWEVPGRDSGHFEIAIYDVVKATASYCHYGYGPFDPLYFPGADLDAADLGHVGIYDVVSITGKYGLEWGSPPP